ncbi:alpha/beta hydrolase [uncultured Tateyamaria sp.]|uniref:alpha/beta hydrolase n=1 Tax=uncultured Tateyamaria sp. TaxID=455651 RepID=UPI002632FD5A|nr:alpha/beta hydrolase [uncultured Tateyamaria sp.]
MADPKRVFDGDLLRADLFNPSGRRLFVSLRQRIAVDGAFSRPNPVRSFIAQDHAHLHIQSRFNDWFVNAETEALEHCLADALRGYGRRVAMGFSMGGYAALRLSRCLDLRHVMLVSPQVSIHPDVVPFDKRFRGSSGGFHFAQGDLGIHGRRQLAGTVIVDPFRALDMRNAHMIQTLFPRIGLARTACSGHPASRVLREAGQFPALQRMLFDPPVSSGAVTVLHRNARRHSAIYWKKLAELATLRKRADLARVAMSRATALGRSRG